ncbi:NUDIX domain-containing protein [Chitinophaga vietnamensis]|uniref:NUDIX domain-containing protein n=1 Tax=Chitinophaga vietnamensis TaxID=2593957 RepID=UPI00117831B5|nr:NUDIX domain-containing protein [Chitinophaga vietnamensis]
MKTSAGILLYRRKAGSTAVFLVHPGGPFWRGKDEGAWSIPKGEYTDGETALEAAVREFEEETGLVPSGDFITLSPVKLKSGKLVSAWAVAGDLDPAQLRSNTCKLEWPPHSGKWVEVPEVDQGAWFDVLTAKKKIHAAQAPMIDELLLKLKNAGL